MQPGDAARLLPALTSLRLQAVHNEQHPQRSLALALAARSQLQELALPTWVLRDSDEASDAAAQQQLQWAVALQQLQGLRRLQVAVDGGDALAELAASVGRQLQGLTLHLSNSHMDGAMAAEVAGLGAHVVRLTPLWPDMPQLTSLQVVASPGALLAPADDLAAAARHVPGLRQLSYCGPVLTTSQPPGCALQPGQLPSQLQGLTVLCRQPGMEEPFDPGAWLRISAGGLPASLTSLRLGGMPVRWRGGAAGAAAIDWERDGLPLTWEVLPPRLQELELELAGSGWGDSRWCVVARARVPRARGRTRREKHVRWQRQRAHQCLRAARCCPAGGERRRGAARETKA
jgi:hypothetical protein